MRNWKRYKQQRKIKGANIALCDDKATRTMVLQKIGRLVIELQENP
ncbi:hypothetical protein RUMHYD_01325 [Blautia hydrogenotrophica DSM 10507]|uniref:Uncharacterized protein n=1 Tax=Blautia hydrogenotrophica (strain DSM 10507 / JCM 14656 / S5a33) TaxID=476272 RepID=C0CKF5_BLAHS|nr:hypothetical protein RUMHYD_01325 [Blautia hydrogenotrophica DSM 10507]